MPINSTRLSEYRAALDDPTVLDTTVSWVSNGERGHLHALSRCHRLTKNANIVNHQISVNDADRRAACVYCFDHGVNQVVKGLRELQLLIKATENIRRYDEALQSTGSLANIHRVIRDMTHADMGLTNIHTSAQENGYIKRYDQVRGDLGKLKARAAHLLTTHSHQILAMTAAELLHDDNAREIPKQIGTPAEDKLFGGERSYGQYHLSRLYSAWLSTKSSTSSQSESIIEQTVNGYQLQQPCQLEGIAFGGATENLAEAVRERWSTEVNSVAERLIARWDDRYTALVNQTEPVLVGVQISRMPKTELGLLVLACHTVASNDELELAFLRVPTLVAKWLEQESASGHRYGSDTKALFRLDGVDAEGNVLDTAVKLWDLRSDTYRDPKVCLEAASALHH